MAAPWAKIAAHSPFLLVNGALSSHTELQSLPLKSVLIYCQRRFDTSLNQRCNAHLMRLRKRGQIYLFGSPTASGRFLPITTGSYGAVAVGGQGTLSIQLPSGKPSTT